MGQKTPLFKSLKFKINLLVTIIFIVVIIFLIYRSNQNQLEMIRNKEEQLNQIAVETIDRRFKVSYEILETSLAQITVSPLIVDTVAQGDSEKLSELVSQAYDKLKEVGVDEFHFYHPDNSSLLNLYEQNNQDNNMSCERTIVEDFNADPNHLPIKGIEECRHGLFLRYIAPIYKGNQYLGSVELGMEIESRILNIFKKVSGGEWYLYSLDMEDHLMIEKTSLDDNFPVSINDELVSSFDEGKVYETEEPPYIIQMIPISNYKGEYKNYFKRVFDNSELIALQNEYTREAILYGFFASLISVSLLWIVMTYLLSPLSYLEQKVRKLESGVLVEPIKVRSNDEIGYLASAMENMRQSLYKREAELIEQSIIDPLTRVFNRLSLEGNLKQVMDSGLSPTTLIMADIDGLKQINDKEGHAVGDAYIINCAKTIKKAMGGSDKIFRIGGDEFVLLFPKTDQNTGELILNQVRNEIIDYNKTLEKGEIPLSVSFGLGVCEGGADCLDRALALADKRMYVEKAEKKKRLV